MIHQESLTVTTEGRGTYDITRSVQQEVRASGVRIGLCHVFVHRTRGHQRRITLTIQGE